MRVLALFGLACFNHAVPALAQETPRPAAEKWRPKDGVYATPGAKYAHQCGETGGFDISLDENLVRGDEWSCEINKLTDTAPATITLDTTCTDAAVETKQYKLIFLLKKIDDKKFSYRSSRDGKFRGVVAEPLSYCPEDTQRRFIESRKEREAEKAKALPEPPFVWPAPSIPR
jgi:hypothetical protein